MFKIAFQLDPWAQYISKCVEEKRAKMWHEPYGPCGLWRGWMCLLRGHKPWFTVKYQTAGNKIMDNTVCFLKVAVNLETQGKDIFHTDIQSILVYDVCCFPITLCDDWLAGDGRKHLLSHAAAADPTKSINHPGYPFTLMMGAPNKNKNLGIEGRQIKWGAELVESIIHHGYKVATFHA